MIKLAKVRDLTRVSFALKEIEKLFRGFDNSNIFRSTKNKMDDIRGSDTLINFFDELVNSLNELSVIMIKSNYFSNKFKEWGFSIYNLKSYGVSFQKLKNQRLFLIRIIPFLGEMKFFLSAYSDFSKSKNIVRPTRMPLSYYNSQVDYYQYKVIIERIDEAKERFKKISILQEKIILDVEKTFRSLALNRNKKIWHKFIKEVRRFNKNLN